MKTETSRTKTEASRMQEQVLRRFLNEANGPALKNRKAKAN
jgi:hypothetical protein